MANLFGILTAITLAIAAFIATKNKSAYERTISETVTHRETLTKSEARLAAALQVLEELPVKRAEVDAEVQQLTATEAKKKEENEATKGEIEKKTAKIAANKQRLDEVREKTQKTGDLKELASKMRATNAELEELSQSIATAEAQLANLTAQNTASEAQVAQSRGNLEIIASGQSLPSLQTRIRSIYPNWGFVTLASGNNAGVVANSTLNVVREGQMIARLLVTAVESSTASASIVPDSLASDVTLMVGDRVVPGENPRSKQAKLTAN
jgi:tRNA nucleotidyltransferase/poly(A) polymerase